MRIVGITPRLSRTIICFFEDDAPPVFQSLKSPQGVTVFKRQKTIVKHVQALLRKHDIVVLEDFCVSDNVSSTGKLVERSELCGMLKLVCPAITELPWLSALPPMLKTFITGQASASNEEMLEAVSRDWGVCPTLNDEAIAFALARYTRSALLHEEMYEKQNQKFEAYGHNFTHLAKIRFFLPTILNAQ